MLRLLVAVLAVVLMSGGAADAQAGRRVALVVGVSNYQHVPKLGNPTNDALDISNAFYRLGFQVQTLIDPDRKSLEERSASSAATPRAPRPACSIIPAMRWR